MCKRRIRRKACKAKVRHATHYQAIAAIRQPGYDGCRVYRCQFCGGYHIGHYDVEKALKIRGII